MWIFSRISSRFARFFVLCPSVLFFLAMPGTANAAGPGGDLYFGYGHLGAHTFYSNAGGLNGWEAAGHLKLMPFVGGEVDVAHYGLGAAAGVPRTTTVLLGPRVTVGAAGVHVFVHGLVGGEHSATSAGSGSVSGGALAIALGGGADFRIAPMFAWRVNADYITAPTQAPGAASHARFGTGLVFRF
jgi:hypothetical protein